MPSAKALNGLPNTLVQMYFSTLASYRNGYMTDHLWDTAARAQVLEARIDVLNDTAEPTAFNTPAITSYGPTLRGRGSSAVSCASAHGSYGERRNAERSCSSGMRLATLIAGTVALGALLMASLPSPPKKPLLLTPFRFAENTVRLVDDTALYAFGGKHLSAPDYLAVIAQLPERNPGLGLLFHGHADPGEHAPDSLALARAELIRNCMLQYNVPPDRIRIASFGSTKPRNDSWRSCAYPPKPAAKPPAPRTGAWISW